MKKYFLGKTDKEVKLGSTISVKENVNTSFGFNEVGFVVTLSKKNIKKTLIQYILVYINMNNCSLQGA